MNTELALPGSLPWNGVSVMFSCLIMESVFGKRRNESFMRGERKVEDLL